MSLLLLNSSHHICHRLCTAAGSLVHAGCERQACAHAHTRALSQDEADVEAFEPPEFQGMLYYDGVDSLGRPVVVVNADAVAAKVPPRTCVLLFHMCALRGMNTSSAMC